MNFETSSEQQQLADALRKVLANDYSFEKRKAIVQSASGFSETVWSTLAEMGLTAMAVPEAFTTAIALAPLARVTMLPSTQIKTAMHKIMKWTLDKQTQ